MQILLPSMYFKINGNRQRFVANETSKLIFDSPIATTEYFVLVFDSIRSPCAKFCNKNKEEIGR